jgi:hypothetical protein
MRYRIWNFGNAAKAIGVGLSQKVWNFDLEKFQQIGAL